MDKNNDRVLSYEEFNNFFNWILNEFVIIIIIFDNLLIKE